MRKRWFIATGLLSAAVLVAVVFSIERGNAPVLVLFAGRFHPAFVHFPIAFLILGAAIELLAPAWARLRRLQTAVPFVFGLGALSALAAAALGYLLSLDGGYAGNLLSWHMWLGSGVFVLSAGIAVVSFVMSDRGLLFRTALACLVVLVVVTGHLGGSLARGSDYLTYYLPDSIKRLTGIGAGSAAGLIANIDSAAVYRDLVQPILDRRCVKCHGASKSKGNLRLDSREGIERGSRDGVVLTPGNPGRSEIVRRITLPPFDEEAMPPEGEPPLDVGETEVVRWWIDHGASFDAKVAELPDMPSAVATYTRRVSAPRERRRSGIFALNVPSPDSSTIDKLRRAGLAIARVDPDSPFLEVSAANVRKRFADADLAALQPIARQISRLDLSRTEITSRSADMLGAMPHLTHVHLEGTRVDGEILAALKKLDYLEYLNLYETGIADSDLVHIDEMKALSSIYLWRTKVSPHRAKALERSKPGLRVNVGSRLIAADSVVVR